MNEEVSKKALLILVIIAVVISVLSTSLVMHAVYNAPAETGGGAVPSGRAILTVPAQPAASGRVSLKVAAADEG
ncbi:hypothetical protein GF323_00765 [Candidatus Woesearchaeota archaeon]|nr:hypothetical protein [Candidatus Woesearchaeota archaeon]